MDISLNTVAYLFLGLCIFVFLFTYVLKFRSRLYDYAETTPVFGGLIVVAIIIAWPIIAVICMLLLLVPIISSISNLILRIRDWEKKVKYYE